MGLFSALGLTASREEKAARRGVNRATAEETARRRRLGDNAGETRGRYLELLEGFDPGAYMERAAGAVGAELSEDHAANVSASNQSLNARGFYGGGMNQGRLQRDFSERLSRALAGLSLQTAGLEQGRIAGFGRQGEYDAALEGESRSNELDLLVGSRDAAIADRNARLRGTLGLLNAGSRFLPVGQGG